MKYGITFAAAGFALLAAAPAFAGDQDFTLVNKTGYDIAEVYASPTKAADWGKDIMGNDVLSNGDQIDITFAPNASACIYDLQVVYSDKESAEWDKVNLCTTNKITIHWTKSSGDTTADIE
jgi:hypothetical protein